MSYMERSTTDRPPGSYPRRVDATEIRKAERTPGTRNFESLILPGLFSASALVPGWLRRRFRRTDTHAVR